MVVAKEPRGIRLWKVKQWVKEAWRDLRKIKVRFTLYGQDFSMSTINWIPRRRARHPFGFEFRYRQMGGDEWKHYAGMCERAWEGNTLVEVYGWMPKEIQDGGFVVEAPVFK